MDGDFVAVRHLRQSCFDKFYEQIDVHCVEQNMSIGSGM